MPDGGTLHWFRRLLLLVFGCGLLAGGLVLVVDLLSAREVCFAFVFAAGSMIMLGSAILWNDIAAPVTYRLRRRVFPPSELSSDDTTHRGGGRVR